MFKVTWLGQGGYILDGGEGEVYIDPYLSNSVERFEGHKRLVPMPVDPAKITPVMVVSTHDHLDHCDPDTVKAMMDGAAGKAGTKFAGPASVVKLLTERLGVPGGRVVSFSRGDTMTVAGFTFHGIYAEHTPDSVGFLVEKDGITAMFTGDSLYNEKVGEGVKCDVLFTCINGKLGNMPVEDALELTKRVGAKVGIPAHYDMFPNNLEDPAKYLDNVCCKGYKAVAGQAFELADLLK